MKSQFIDGKWVEGASPFDSYDPATSDILWRGTGASPEQVGVAVSAATHAQPEWERIGHEARIALIERFCELVRSDETSLGDLIARETGKPFWEAKTEVAALVGKLAPSVEAYLARCSMTSREVAGARSVTRFRAIGVMAVVGPFNFPAHMPNGHIVPALIAGNTVVFKPSELTPAVAERVVQLWERAGLPRGVLNLVQGGPEVSQTLVQHSGVHGVAVTGSRRTGLAISAALAGSPEKLLALELGGSSPLIVWDVPDLKATLNIVINSTFITSGQRCSAARRLILSPTAAKLLMNPLREALSSLRIGACHDDPQPYMGPVISRSAAAAILRQQKELIDLGGTAILEAKQLDLGPAFLSPALIDMTGQVRSDEEVFGPLLQVRIVDDFESALTEANATESGLAAGLVSESRSLYEQFSSEIHAGIIAWNQQLTGASGLAPFGGIGKSGNHRPSGFLATDYCTYAIGALERDAPILPATLSPGLQLPD